MFKNFKIYVPNGSIEAWEVIVDHIPPESEVNWNTKYTDGHREGILYCPDGEMYTIEEC